jgi:hypothetical protein
MKLVASMIVRNEMKRYLRITIPALMEFCDEVRVLDDRSTDGTLVYLQNFWPKVRVKEIEGPSCFEHEGQARQELLEWAVDAEPTHILGIDADEIVGDGQALRNLPRSRSGVWSLQMEEVWNASANALLIRSDGGWRPHPIPILWAVSKTMGRMDDKQLACGREPLGIRRLGRHAVPTRTSIFHFGWANEGERKKRHQRYVKADGGRFHASAHLDSIMWPDEKCSFLKHGWPSGLESRIGQLVLRANA